MALSIGGDPAKDPELAAFLIARSQAIQSYAHVEQGLCGLFAHLSETTPPVAATIFFRVTNSPSRIAILDQLMRRKHGASNRLFFNSLTKALRPLDGCRNEIVHWNTVATVVDTDRATDFCLQPPNFWAWNRETPEWSTERLIGFAEECDFYWRLTNMFTWFLTGTPPAARGPPWPDIFRQPLTYPPQAAHPLAQQPPAPGSPPPPSGG